MRIDIGIIQQLTITDAVALDPIRVMTEDLAPGAGRITITCYGEAWNKYWGGMGNQTISEFFLDCSACYLTDKLSGAREMDKAQKAYLTRIVEAVQEAFRQIAHEGVAT